MKKILFLLLLSGSFFSCLGQTQIVRDIVKANQQLQIANGGTFKFGANTLDGVSTDGTLGTPEASKVPTELAVATALNSAKTLLLDSLAALRADLEALEATAASQDSLDALRADLEALEATAVSQDSLDALKAFLQGQIDDVAAQVEALEAATALALGDSMATVRAEVADSVAALMAYISALETDIDNAFTAISNLAGTQANDEDSLAVLKSRYNALKAAVGINQGATDLGTFTGSTIPDNSTVKGALQAVETAVGSALDTLAGLSDDVGDIQAELNTFLPDIASVRETGYTYFDECTAIPFAVTTSSTILGDYSKITWTGSTNAQVFYDTSLSFTNLRLGLLSTSSAYNGVLRFTPAITKQGGDFEFETRIKTGTETGTFSIRIGLGETISGNSMSNANTVYLAINSQPSNWYLGTLDNGSAGSDTDTGIAYATDTFYKLRFVYDHSPTPTYSVYINGVLAGTKTSNLPHPTKNLVPFVYLSKSGGTAAPLFWVDYAYFSKPK